MEYNSQAKTGLRVRLEFDLGGRFCLGVRLVFGSGVRSGLGLRVRSGLGLGVEINSEFIITSKGKTLYHMCHVDQPFPMIFFSKV